MAKEICMLQRSEKGKECRTYFIQLEKAWNSPEQILARALKMADKVIAQKDKLITEMKPKADFFDAVADSKTAVPIGDVAKVLGIKGLGRNNLFELLRDKKVLMNNNRPYQKYVDNGYFRVIEQHYTVQGEEQINFKTLVYQKGIDYIRKIVA
jgi:anti-repressor protein